MSDHTKKQRMFLDRMAAHVLENGLTGASLRPLAKAAGTSDRMLIYHFGSKEGLVAALLTHLAAMFTATLDGALPPGRAAGRPECLTEIAGLMDRPEASAFAPVWLDIVSGAARGAPGYRETAGDIVEGFLAWIAARLPENDPDPGAGAALILTLVEGALVMGAAGRADVPRDALAALSGTISPRAPGSGHL